MFFTYGIISCFRQRVSNEVFLLLRLADLCSHIGAFLHGLNISYRRYAEVMMSRATTHKIHTDASPGGITLRPLVPMPATAADILCGAGAVYSTSSLRKPALDHFGCYFDGRLPGSDGATQVLTQHTPPKRGASRYHPAGYQCVIAPRDPAGAGMFPVHPLAGLTCDRSLA